MEYHKINNKELFEFLKEYHFIFDINNFEYNFFQHLLIYGYKDINKIDLIRHLLYNYYILNDKSNIIFHIEKNTYNIPTNLNSYNIYTKNENIQLHINKSPIHWEIDFNLTGNNTNNKINNKDNDYYILKYIINFLCKNSNLNNVFNQKIIVFNNIHSLNKKYQKQLFNTMEKHYNDIKFIFISDYLNNIESSLLSRCILVRIPMYFNYLRIQSYNKNNIDKFIYSKKETLEYNKIFFYYNFSKCLDKRYVYLYIIYIYNKDTNSQKIVLNHLYNIDNKLIPIKYSPDIFFNQLSNNIIEFSNKKLSFVNKKKIYDIINLSINNYFTDCHYMNEFLNDFLCYITYNNSHISNEKMFDITKLISNIEYKSLFCDYNNYLVDNFVSNILYILN